MIYAVSLLDNAACSTPGPEGVTKKYILCSCHAYIAKRFNASI